jgi:peptidoglycan L-alanyl-D-glutamate endopeptidase CwlK
MINSRSLDELHPVVQAKCQAFLDKCEAQGIDVIITSTYRDSESQEALYAQGRTAPGKCVTNVRGGFSYHNWRVAFDFVPCVNGKCVWNDNDLWERCGTIAEECGLEWGGRWTKFVDKPHCQYTGGLKIADFQSGMMIA